MSHKTDTKDIWIVIPALNEAHRIAGTIKDVQSHGYSSIIVVDDGSGDDTYSVARKLTNVIRHPVTCGYGASLTTGGAYALEQGADIIVHFDGDGQFDARDIDRMVEPLLSGEADIVFGSRYLSNTKNRLPLSKKYLIHKPALFVQNTFTNLHFTDIHNGFRAISSRAYLEMRLVQDKMAYASEIVSEVHRLKLRYTEVPVTISYREYGQGFIGGLLIIRDLFIKKFIQ